MNSRIGNANSEVEHITANQHHSTVQTVQQTCGRETSFFKEMWVGVRIYGVILSCEEPTRAGWGGITPLFIHRLLGTGNRRQGQYIIANTPALLSCCTHIFSVLWQNYGPSIWCILFWTQLPKYTSTQNTRRHTHINLLTGWLEGKHKTKRQIKYD